MNEKLGEGRGEMEGERERERERERGTRRETTQEEWESTVPAALSRDLLWKLHVYRAALFLLDAAMRDADLLRRRRREGIAEQLVRAAGSVSANIAEGYSRSSPRDRVRLLDYALGSARECITWYQAAAGILSPEALDARHELLSRIRGMTLRLIAAQRSRGAIPGPGRQRSRS